MYLFSEYEAMHQKQIRFDELYLQLCEEIEGVRKMAQALSLPWEGEANKRYLIRLQADLLTIQKIMERLFAASQMLSEAIMEYQKTEAVVAAVIGGLRL